MRAAKVWYLKALSGVANGQRCLSREAVFGGLVASLRGHGYTEFTFYSPLCL
ncbi:Uncharacterised protein [Vibrio cholerae]|nr:Uncharacterised protein [Vibrio cholerae]